MPTFSLPMTELIHENLSVVMTFAYSRKPFEQLLNDHFVGYWKYLEKTLFDVSERRANKACIELALYLRMLDDDQRFSEYLRATSDNEFGILRMKEEKVKALHLRDVCNKIIHAQEFRWIYDCPEAPVLECISAESEKWEKAEISLVAVAAFCGELLH